MSESKTFETLVGLSLDADDYLKLLEKLIGETKHLMNRPPEFVPQEKLAARHVIDILKPYSTENGGPLTLKEIEYTPGRSNLIVTYPGTTDKTVSFVGSHFDVVHADPESWEKDPFKLTIEGDKLHGRGTTDCLGHVALLTNIFKQLATLKPQLAVSVIGVMIADEESGGSDEAVGVEGLMKAGELSIVKNGPVYWLDCADMQPNVGSGGVVQWSLTARGKIGHSGFPQKVVNTVEFASDVLKALQDRFYKDFPKHPREEEYDFPCSSSFKPTTVKVPEGSLNQIPGECTISGDIRLIPFYKIKDVKTAIDGYLKDLHESHFEGLATRGPDSKYYGVPACDATVELKWLSEGIDGIACDLHSPGFKCLAAATKKFVGFCQPLADTGSLPLVADLQAEGYDVQTVGYGVEDAYHADNEFSRLSDFQTGFKILLDLIANLDKEASA